jgi:hypothetical protein
MFYGKCEFLCTPHPAQSYGIVKCINNLLGASNGRTLGGDQAIWKQNQWKKAE